MAFLYFLLKTFLFFIFFSKPVSSQQSYDQTSCDSTDQPPAGSRYICNSTTHSCQTFIAYRSRQGFQTVSAIAGLLDVDQSLILRLNNLNTPSQILAIGRDVLIPINCSCSGEFFQSSFSYVVPESTSYSEIACGVFEGLLKSQTLVVANPYLESDLKVGSKLSLPLKCACPDEFAISNGVKYLVTYPFIFGDGTTILGKKFGIPPSEIWAENSLQPSPTVFPNTTILVPLRGEPVINESVGGSMTTQPPTFVPTNPTNSAEKSRNPKLYILGGGVAFLAVVLLLFSGWWYVKMTRRWKHKKLMDSALSSPISHLTSDLYIGMSMLKYSLYNYSFDELKLATSFFSEENKMGSSGYKGRIGGFDVIIKRMSSDDCFRIIDIYSKINHTNIVKLLGVCYDESDRSLTYLVYEFAGNGCLRDCLSNPCNVLQWKRRTQIAFDIAMGLHYLHHCTAPSYIHMNLCSKNILITGDWRAKIANFGTASVLDAKGDMMVSIGGWTAPECLVEGFISPKVDIFGFGVVLFELISGKEIPDGKLIKETLGYLGGGGSDQGGYFDKLRSFMDPNLNGDYPLGEALGLAVLTKACVEDDPKHRPSMNDSLKILARMV